ncbi:TonB-dependent receptor [Sphingomonas sp. DBB INV C78]|uniref:TonB-dependent receptor n=1 Tax=Sphingomonas sp. DBB INV C78 TaxID=3349434 RepID=UPI0036D3EE8F
MSKQPKHLWISCASFALVAGFNSQVAWAQSTLPTNTSAATESSQADIVVTGSRIRRDPLQQDAPIVFVDQSDIAKTGLNSVGDVLQRLPSSGGGLNGKFNNSGNLGNPPDGGGVGAGAAEVDLRYLGSRRVLVLVDGIRYVNGASASGVPGSTDLNSIPESAIERIEVLQDGASAIYGSDAIAGVVNIITKKGQAGFIGSAQIGLYEQGDGASENFQLSWGNGTDGPFQVVIGGNYNRQRSVSAGDRAISRFPAPYSDTCADGGCSGFLPNGRYAIFGQDLTLINPVLGRVATPADFRDFVSPDDRFNFGPFNYLQIPLERYGLFGNFRYEVSDAVNLSAKLLWNQRKSKNQAAPLPFGVGQAAGITPVLDGTSVDATNPFNPFGVTLDASNTDFIYRRFVEGGPRQFHQDVDTIYGVATLDGRFGGDWYWDVNAAYGENKAKQKMFGNINSGNLRQALGPIADCTAPCVPFNLFGGAGSITQEMMDFVTFVQQDKSKQETLDLTGNITGKLLTLPGGPLGIAAGVEYRDLKGRFDPDPIVAAGFSSDIPALPTKGSYSVWEGYLELNAPLISDKPFAQLLELNGAVRFSDYSKSGSTTTFKGGVNWKPITDLRLRGSYSEGFRAPSIGELFGTQSRFDQQLDDPCSSHPDTTAARNFQNDATVRANCIAAGVPASGSYQQANPQISVLVGGNEDLSPETSKSWNFGAVYSPSFFTGLSLEVDYYDIKVRGAIQSIDAEVTVTNCAVNNDPTACGLVTRAGGGQLTQVVGLLQNIAGIDTDGLDVNLTYRTGETDWGNFGFTWNNTFLFNYDVIVPTATGTQTISREGTEQGSPSQGFPDWKAIGILDWDKDDFGATLTGRYVSKLKEAGGNVMKARFYTDLQLRLMIGEDKDFGFALGVNNMFNVKAPGCVTCDINNFDPTTYDLPGRYFYARASLKM